MKPDDVTRTAYAEKIAGSTEIAWWTAVVLTASSERQAQLYRDEIRRRRAACKIPDISYLVVPDLNDKRIGSGGATLNALLALARERIAPSEEASGRAWWARQRVFLLHSGGDSRRLPQYSLGGKLFSPLPVGTPWGDVSTVFDEMLALSTAWAPRMPAGLLVASGDVLLNFDAGALNWTRAGVTGVAIRVAAERAVRHGVYVADDFGRVYSFLQKPSREEMKSAGALSRDDTAAVDTGLLYFAPELAAALAGVARTDWFGPDPPVLDMYQHFTRVLTGEWEPPDAPGWQQLGRLLKRTPFWCCLADGEFTHIGTTQLFRRSATEPESLSGIIAAQQRLGVVRPPGVLGTGVVLDSVFSAGAELDPGSVALECDLEAPVRLGRGSILHGVCGLGVLVEVPEDTVVHQIPIQPAVQGHFVVRVYGVEDDPNIAGAGSTWFGRPMQELFDVLGMDPEQVWPGIPAGGRSLWNAELFPVGPLETVWACVRWMLRYPSTFSSADWRRMKRLSLASSIEFADTDAIAGARTRRTQKAWAAAAASLAESGADVRPLLAYPAGVAALADAGRRLRTRAVSLQDAALPQAASLHFQSSLFFSQAGLVKDADAARADAFSCVQRAVEAGAQAAGVLPAEMRWVWNCVQVAAPPRIDLGGGWSDTPPFCLDWGGTVLNIAVRLNGRLPIRTRVRRLAEPLIRLVSDESKQSAEYRTMQELLTPAAPGCPFCIPLTVLKMLPGFAHGTGLAATLSRFGGGLEISTSVDLPMGSGLGTSSILGATVVRAIAEMAGTGLTDDALTDQVMRLEQLMTTGGGWQDQAGGIHPGAKLLSSGPGLRQRLRVQPVQWTPEREAEFSARLVLFYTGIRRIAKDLLAQVVGSYLAREAATVEVLHSIKTLAMEMAHAMREGEWDYLGRLMDRHWGLNKVLDPHTTNRPINAMLDQVRPYSAGAKLAGAGGGGYLIILARDPDAAAVLRRVLAASGGHGAVSEHQIAGDGWEVAAS